jgi:hypothetical protein
MEPRHHHTPWQFAPTANNTVSNLFTALLLATCLDVGHITSNKIFTNIDAVNEHAGLHILSHQKALYHFRR